MTVRDIAGFRREADDDTVFGIPDSDERAWEFMDVEDVQVWRLCFDA